MGVGGTEESFRALVVEPGGSFLAAGSTVGDTWQTYLAQ